MSYPTLPDRAIPYHVDGSEVRVLDGSGNQLAVLSSADMAELNDTDYTEITAGNTAGSVKYLVVIFPEQRVVSAVFALAQWDNGGYIAPSLVEGSTDTTNGWDGTWSTASAPNGYNDTTHNVDSWRKGGVGGEGWQTISFTGAVKAVRIKFDVGGSPYTMHGMLIAHLYGHKASGQTPDDIIFVDPATSTEFSVPLDWGDQEAGTSVTKQIALKNTSSSLTAQSITLTSSSHWELSTDQVNWSQSLSVGNLAAGATSSTIYVRCNLSSMATQQPERAAIEVSVGSWA